jgi:hypothetical protein
MNGFVTLAAGVLASVGMGGLVMAAASKDAGRRTRSLRVGAGGLTVAGLVVMVGGVAGWIAPSEVYGGILMVLFGTGLRLPPARTSRPTNLA